MIAEHKQTRNASSLFDISHMGQLRLVGKNRAANLELLAPVSFSKLRIGDNKFTFMLDEKGGIIDDMVIGVDKGAIFIVCNASRKADVCEHITKNLHGDCQLEVEEGNALVAVQGPASARLYDIIDETLKDMTFMKSRWIKINGKKSRVTRCGYTGEDGYEISVPADASYGLADLLLGSLDCKLAGLGARDTLRLEAGLCLYGNELGLDTSPIEARLGWAIVKSARKDAAFIGAEAVLDQIKNGTPRKLVGLVVDGKVPIRAGAELIADGKRIGAVTSGTFSPQLEKPIALGYVETAHAKTDTPLLALVRGKEIACMVASLPFVPHRYVHAISNSG